MPPADQNVNLRLDPAPEPEVAQTPFGRIMATIAGRTKSEPWRLEWSDVAKAAAHAVGVLVTAGPPVLVAIHTYGPQIADYLKAHDLMPAAAGALMGFSLFAGKLLSYLPQGPSAPVASNDPTASPRDPQVVEGIVLHKDDGPPSEFVVVRPPA